MGGCSSSQTGKKARGERALNSPSPRMLINKSVSAKKEPTFLSATTAVKVVDMDGGVREFEPPISAGQVVSTTNPNCFLCSWETMLIDTHVQRVSDEEVLQPAHLYFLMPTSQSKKRLSLKDLCVLAIKASSKLSIHDFQPSRRRHSIMLTWASMRDGIQTDFIISQLDLIILRVRCPRTKTRLSGLSALATLPPRLMMNGHQGSDAAPTSERCGSSVVRAINAPLQLVWSLVQRFDQPQAYKMFVKSCTMLHAAEDGVGSGGGGNVGSIREVCVVSGLPATTSVERLDRLDHELHEMVISIIGGDHKLANYQSTTRLHEAECGKKTVVTESYTVDVPMDSNKEDTRLFVETVIGFNLKSLAGVAETMDAC